MQNKKLARLSVSGPAVTLQPVSRTRRKKGLISIINIIKGLFTPRDRKSLRLLADNIINPGRAEENSRSSPPGGSRAEPGIGGQNLGRACVAVGEGRVRWGSEGSGKLHEGGGTDTDTPPPTPPQTGRAEPERGVSS